MNKIESIIFVCLGNICRSPIAEGIAKRYCEENNINIIIESAGTGSWHVGEQPHVNSIKVSKMNGIDITTQRSRQFTKKDIEKYDLVIGLDDSNVTNLKKLGVKNVVKLGSFGYNGADVPDPYFYDGFEGFDKVFEMIEICVKNLINEKID